MPDRGTDRILDTPQGPPRRSGLPNVLSWIAQVGLGLVIAGGGVTKLTADPAMVDMFRRHRRRPRLRVFVGVCEIAGGLGLLVPRLRALAAVLWAQYAELPLIGRR